MIQYNLDLQYRIAGYFTLEKSLVGYNLERIEGLLGYERGRLRQGADFYTFYSPNGVDGFERAATTVFPGDRFLKSPLGQQINTRTRRREDLQMLRRKRLIKVVPVESHFEAMRKYFSAEDFMVLDEMIRNSLSPREFLSMVKRNYSHQPRVIRQVEKNYAAVQDLYEVQLDNQGRTVNDLMYPMARGGSVLQWKLTKPVFGRCLCRITHYHDDLYQRL
ncbi:MAG: hypothetical protein AAFW73_21640 [Bacteroidota bacterium]